MLGIALFCEISIAIIGSGLKSLDSEGPTVKLGFGSPEAIGKLLLERFLIAFEAASLLLLIAAVGAVVLAARRREDGGGDAAGSPAKPPDAAPPAASSRGGHEGHRGHERASVRRARGHAAQCR